MKLANSEAEFWLKYRKGVRECPLDSLGDIEKDSDGQLLIYTGAWVWSDGSVHTQSESDTE